MVNGTLVWYYHICKRQVWFMGRGIKPYQGFHLLEEGKALSEIVFKRLSKRKEVLIDGKIKVDLIKGKMVFEVKKSSKFLEASIMQIKFYLYYFEVFKGVFLEGFLVFPKERRKIGVKLESGDRKRIKKVIKEIREIIERPLPPPLERNRFCKKCAYKEMCWV